MVLALIVGAWLTSSVAAWAHPLGNLSSNSSAAIEVAPDRLAVDYVLDLAEVPAFQARQAMGLVESEVDPADAQRWADERCDVIAAAMRLEVDGAMADLAVEDVEITFPDGDAGLVILRLSCLLASSASASSGQTVTYLDTTDLGRAGWREVLVRSVGDVEFGADVPSESSSDRLRDYPDGVVPPRVTSATIAVGTGAAPSGGDGGVAEDGLDPITRAIESMTGSLTDLVARETFTPGFALLAIVLAILFGALHALAPGHGKTVMAAYLVSRRGTTRQALGLGLTTAVTHTVGVLVLGLVLTATQAFAPADLYPWLGLSSGLLFVVIGLVLLRRTIRLRGHLHGTGPGQHTHDHLGRTIHHHHHDHDHDNAHDHDHDNAHDHDHDNAHDHDHDHDHADDHDHDHADDHHEHEPEDVDLPALTTWRAMVLPGFAGGLVPSPSALVVLVGGIALGRTWFGILLVAAYGIGMAATLVAAGYLLSRSRGWIQQRANEDSPVGTFARVLPIVTAAVVVLGGVLLTLRSTVTLL